MASATLVSPEEYLSTSYQDGDREFVDGHVIERNMGEKSHGKTQTRAVIYLDAHYGNIVWPVVETRVQVKSARFRVPDVLAMLGAEPGGEIITTPPFIVIEVLSKDDRADDLQEKIDDYLEFGVSYVWVLNPRLRTAYVYTPREMRKVTDALRTENPELIVPLAALF